MALALITTFGDEPADQTRLVGAIHIALVETPKVPTNDPTVWHRHVETTQVVTR